jgi:alkaline phosphatase
MSLVRRIVFPLILSLGACGSAAPPRAEPVAANPALVPRQSSTETPEGWFRSGAQTAAALRGAQAGSAKNIILFLGDGMSMTTITAARILEGQRQGSTGEEHRLAFEEFPYTALSRTYEVDAQIPDSAGTMSAIMTGIKTRYGVIGMSQRVRRGDCTSASGNGVLSALELASAAGLATGAVTTTRITHATPAATYAHTVERNWEGDADMPEQAREQGCTDIARQLVEFSIGHGLDVAFGGGRSRFLPTTVIDPEYPQLHGQRLDGRDLIAEWQRVPDSRFVWNAAQFNALDPTARGRVLGLFEPEHMHFSHDRREDAAGEPSLAEMTSKAIALLKRNDKGFFLVVESGRIDHAHHYNNAFRALDETIALSDAVRAAEAATNAADTLILVTADHSHTLIMAGYPVRGNPILGKVRGRNADGGPSDRLSTDAAGRSYTTLGYANGPGNNGASSDQAQGPKHFVHEPSRYDPAPVQRPNLDEVDTEDPDYLQEAGIPMKSETHAGEDVAVYARGPGAAAVHGSIEQNVLFHLMVQANPAMRKRLCELGRCDDHEVPLQVVDPVALRKP